MTQCCAATHCKGRFFPLDMGAKGHTDLSGFILTIRNHQHMHRFQQYRGKIKGLMLITAGQGRQTILKTARVEMQNRSCQRSAERVQAASAGPQVKSWGLGTSGTGDTAGRGAGSASAFQPEDTKITQFQLMKALWLGKEQPTLLKSPARLHISSPFSRGV